MSPLPEVRSPLTAPIIHCGIIEILYLSLDLAKYGHLGTFHGMRKHDVTFAVRYHYLNLVFEKTPDAGEPNIFMKLLFNAPKAGTIESAKTEEVVLGLGIPRNVYAYVKQSKDHGKDEKEDEDEDEDEDQDEDEDDDQDEDEEEDEEEVDNVDWSEIRPTPELEKDYEDQNDEAMHQSMSVNTQVDGHRRG